jgi:hypothetical protein
LIAMGVLLCAWAAGDSKDECLGCHDYDKIADSTKDYVAPSGEKGTPHRYVPHDSKKREDIPECTKCHKAHALDPLPTKGSLDRTKIGFAYCYDRCHHEQNLTSCKQCHP